MAQIPTSINGGGQRRAPRASNNIVQVRNVDAQAEIMRESAKALGEFGADIGNFGEKLDRGQQERVLIDVKTRENQARERLSKLLYGDGQTEGLYAKKGANALDVDKTFEDEFEKIRGEAFTGLDDIRGRAALAESLDSAGRSSRERVITHLTSERTSYSQNLLDAGSDLAVSNAALDKDGQVFKDSFATITKNAAEKAKMMGFAPGDEAYNGFVKQEHGRLISARLSSLFSSEDPQDLKKAADELKFYQGIGAMDAKNMLAMQDLERQARPKVQAYDAMAGMQPASQDPNDVFASMLEAESNTSHYNADGSVRTSPVGAKGIAQLMEPTARAKAKELGIDPDKWQDPDVNLQLGQAYFQEMLDTFNGDTTLAVMAYNAGPNAVKDFMNGTNTSGKNDKGLKLGDPRTGEVAHNQFISEFPFAETKNYVSKVMGRVPAGNGPIDEEQAKAKAATMPEDAGQEFLAMVKRQNEATVGANKQQVQSVLDEAMQYAGKVDLMPVTLKAQAAKLGLAEGLKAYTGQTDGTTADYLYSLSPKQLVDLDLDEPGMRLKLSEADYKDWKQRQNNVAQNPKQAFDMERRQKMTTDAFAFRGMPSNPNKSGVRERMVRFNKLLDLEINDFTQGNNGKYPNNVDLQRMIDNLFIEGEYDVAGVFADREYLFDIKPDDITDKEKLSIERQLKQQNSPVTQALIIKQWVKNNYGNDG